MSFVIQMERSLKYEKRGKPQPIVREYKSLREMTWDLAPTYKAFHCRPFLVTIGWEPYIADFMWEHNESRCQKRCNTYLIPGEIERSRGSIRFGHKKGLKGGYKGLRGDFCLTGGVYDDKAQHLTVLYRSLEIMEGLHYDLVLFDQVYNRFPFKKLTIFAAVARLFAVSGGNSTNDKLYSKLHKTIYKR